MCGGGRGVVGHRPSSSRRGQAALHQQLSLAASIPHSHSFFELLPTFLSPFAYWMEEQPWKKEQGFPAGLQDLHSRMLSLVLPC